MTRVLHVSKELTFPPDFVTSTAVIYGGKGMGKTNLGSVIVEELARAQLRFAVLDAPGVWWGLRFDVSGKGPGIEVLILGGVHGDIPIEPTGGAVVADLVADEDASVVIDISRRPNGTMWSIGERVRFVTDYCKRLYQRQGEKRRPVMQLIDEAARFIPQIVRQGEQQVAACMGAIAAMVEEGRNVGIGVTLITQRSARLNKDVAELADAMISFRTVGPNSRRAVLDWLGEHIEKKRIKELDEKLRALPRGTALVVSPGWLEFEGVVHFRERHTFDSSATPKPGEAAKKVSGGAKPDLSKYAERMKETIERVAATDPRALQKKVAELQAQVKKIEAAKVPAAKVEIKEVYVVKDSQVTRLTKAIEKLDTVRDRLAQAQQVVVTESEMLRAALAKATGSAPATPPARPPIEYATIRRDGSPRPVRGLPFPRPSQPPANRPAVAPRAPLGDREATEDLGKGERAILTAIAQHSDGVSREQITVLTGYRRSTRDRYLQYLAAKALVTEDHGAIRATAEGIAALGPHFEPLPTGAALLEHWRRTLPSGEKAILESIVAAYPATVTRDAITEATGYQRSTRDRYLQYLQSRKLVDAGRGEVRASDMLFEAAGG